MSRRSIPAALLGLSLAGCVGTSAATTGAEAPRPESQDSARLAAGGIAFVGHAPRVPQAVAQFDLGKTYRYPDPQFGTQYTYEAGRRRVDVYVYPIGAGPPFCDEDCQWSRVMDQARVFPTTVPELVRMDKFEEGVVGADTTLRLSDAAARARYIRLDVVMRGAPGISEFFLWPFDGFFIKLRETAPVAAGTNLVEFARALAPRIRPRYECPFGRFEGPTARMGSEEKRNDAELHAGVVHAFEELGYELAWAGPGLWVSEFIVEYTDAHRVVGGDLPHPGVRVVVVAGLNEDGVRHRLIGAEIACRVSDEPKGRTSPESMLALVAGMELTAAIEKHFERFTAQEQ